MTQYQKAINERVLGILVADKAIKWEDAKDQAERNHLKWFMVEMWAGQEYEKQQRAGIGKWN